jgi:hypothetical protein
LVRFRRSGQWGSAHTKNALAATGWATVGNGLPVGPKRKQTGRDPNSGDKESPGTFEPGLKASSQTQPEELQHLPAASHFQSLRRIMVMAQFLRFAGLVGSGPLPLVFAPTMRQWRANV